MTLGHILVEGKLILPSQVEIALKAQRETGQRLGRILLERQWLDEASLYSALSLQNDVDFVRLKDISIPSEVISIMPATFAVHYQVVPLRLDQDILTVATDSPWDILRMDEISLAVPYRVKAVLATEKDILEALRAYYGVGAETIARMMDRTTPPEFREEKVEEIDQDDSEASISKFLNQVLLEAYKDAATDIHIEPFIDELRVRYRVDGVMRDAKVPKNIRHFQDAISSRIKILSNLNIAEKRLPQDGRFKARAGSVDLDLRVSFLPTPCGESAVLRVLNAAKLYSLEDLGLSEQEAKLLRQLTDRPHGIIFLTGPTGSGKTTTLYACLSRMNTDARKIITIEDPIEYQLKGVTQIQISPAIGLTFAQGLRSMLRHDPDIVMVGEVRDQETATTAVQAALTGHLILSTLHTNDAVSGVIRLLDMGVEPYLVAGTVQGFIAQRLVRRVCLYCRQAVLVTPKMTVGFSGEDEAHGGLWIYDAQGCDMCHGAGYRGREAIYEFFVLDDVVRQMILDRASAETIKAQAVASGMRTLRQSGWEKVKQGVTTLQEIVRVTQGEKDSP